MRFWRWVQGSLFEPRPLSATWSRQEVRERGARERARVVEQAQEPVVAGIEAPGVVAQELAAELQGVPALQPGELLVELVDLRQAVLDGGRGADAREAAAPLDGAEPAIGWVPAMPTSEFSLPIRPSR
jgi:hypothetical protein